MKIIYKDIDVGTETKNISPMALFESANFQLGENDIMVKRYENVKVEDLTVIYSQSEINLQNLEYLSSTDWYVTRASETGKAIPEDVLTKRAEAREAIK
jgi:hypothetical protein